MANGTGGFVSPDKILAQLPLQEGASVADLGCGHGYFTIPVAKLVGKDGVVKGVDVLNESLEAVRSQVQINGLLNIETLRGNLEILGGSKIADSSMDLALLHNVLFQSQKKNEILREAKRILKSGGTLTVIDWLAPQTKTPGLANLGPQEGWFISAGDMKKLAESEDFIFQKDLDAGEYHFGLLFAKL
ncbi:MAG: class I SAM-dependent methyltransferase [Patescibacteria group bacterium]